MVAAQRFNQQEQNPTDTIYGCVTTGELWQFLRLHEKQLAINPHRIYIEHVDLILGTFMQILAE